MATRNKIYFASDFHLGTGTYTRRREREDRLVRWLESIKNDASEVFLMGDVFDFWFEYKSVVPKGYIRFFGKLAELSDAGVKLYLFKGNHDMWMFDYFEKELGATIISDELEIARNGKKFFLHHGDGLGHGDPFYKILKVIFRSTLCQWLFARIHPNFGVGIANYWSGKSRETNDKRVEPIPDPHKRLIDYCNVLLKTSDYDYMLFGHHHNPDDILISKGCHFINLGDWINHNSYAVFDGDSCLLKYFEK